MKSIQHEGSVPNIYLLTLYIESYKMFSYYQLIEKVYLQCKKS